MKYCLDCRRAWPSEALICGTCRRSFGGRLCANKHLSPAGSSCCVTCGSRILLHPARYLNLSTPIWLCSWLIGILLLKLIVANFGLLVELAVGGVEAIGSFVIGLPLGRLLASLTQTAVVLGLVWMGFRRILGATSVPVKTLEFLVTLGVRQLPNAIRWSATIVTQAVSSWSRKEGHPLGRKRQ